MARSANTTAEARAKKTGEPERTKSAGGRKSGTGSVKSGRAKSARHQRRRNPQGVESEVLNLSGAAQIRQESQADPVLDHPH